MLATIGPLYGYAQLAATLVLLVAADPRSTGFRGLLYVIARDDYAPRAVLHLGDRLASSVDIVVLAAAALYAAFGERTEPLIPLFAVGVFVAFTLAHSAMMAVSADCRVLTPGPPSLRAGEALTPRPSQQPQASGTVPPTP